MTSTKFNWRCVYCQKRNIEHVAFQFDIPKSYTAVWCCSKCGKENEISFIFYAEGYTTKKHI